ncbi:hypothetical protein AHF37_10498 [Paragonimus kellicotti]|nr:hypothetical protein AHF37_10498 [Paragonimus kellicotti]
MLGATNYGVVTLLGSDLDVAIRLQVEEVERLNAHQTIRKSDAFSLPTQPYPVRSSAVSGSPTTTTHSTVGKSAPYRSSTVENRVNERVCVSVTLLLINKTVCA